MKDERNVRQRRAAGRRWQPVAILLAAVLMVLSVPLGLRSAHAVDLNSDCSLNVKLTGDVTMADDIKTANAVIDLYRIANAVPVQDHDTYDWSMNTGFESLVIDKEMNSDSWKNLAQQAADIVLGTAPEGAETWDPSESTGAIDDSLKSLGNSPETPVTGLDAGLYLVIARGSDVKEYATTVTDQTAGTSGTATIANSRTYAYKFSPELISIPTKEAEDNIINTANSGPWIYDASATLKPSREIRVGDLLITKILDDYRQREKEVGDNPRLIKDPATFVFEVTAYEKTDNEDKTQAPVIYHDYVSIVFDAFGTKSVLIGELPVDSFVVVKEAYHGNYTAYPDQTTTIKASETVGVEFENTYDDGEPGGGSVTNHFEYTEKDGWVQKEQVDNTEESSEVGEDKTAGNQ